MKIFIKFISIILIPNLILLGCSPVIDYSNNSQNNITQKEENNINDSPGKVEVNVVIKNIDFQKYTNSTYTKGIEVKLSDIKSINNSNVKLLSLEKSKVMPRSLLSKNMMYIKNMEIDDNEVILDYGGDIPLFEQKLLESFAKNIIKSRKFTEEQLQNKIIHDLNNNLNKKLSLKSLKLLDEEDISNITDEDISNIVNEIVLNLSNQIVEESYKYGNEILQESLSNGEIYLLNGLIKDTNSLNEVTNAFEEDVKNYDNELIIKNTKLKRLNNGARIIYGSDDDIVRQVSNIIKYGDILWNAYDEFGSSEILSGHTGVYCKNDQGKNAIFTIMGFDYKVDWNYSFRSHVAINQDGKKKIKSAKVISVNGKSSIEGQKRVVEMMSRYAGRGYGIPYFKSDDRNTMYCSQLSWLTWNKSDLPEYRNSNVDIDGSPFPQGTWFKYTLYLTYTYTFSIGWITISVVVPVISIIWTLITIDVVYPWDIVIDDNTTDLARWGDYYDHP